MFKNFPGLCKEQTSQTEADKFFKIDIANKCTHQGLLLVFRTRDRFARVCRLNHVGRIVEKECEERRKIFPMLGAGETQVFASVLHGPKDARGCPRRLGSSISLRGKNPTPSVEHIGRNNMSTESCRAEQRKKKRRYA